MGIDPSVFGYVTKEEQYEDKAVIIKEGSAGSWIYVILEGKVKVKKLSPRGMVVVATLTEGDVFGEMVLWQQSNLSRSASIVAEGPVRVGVLDMEQLRKDYETVSPRLRSLIKILMTRLKETTDKAVSLASETAESL